MTKKKPGLGAGAKETENIICDPSSPPPKPLPAPYQLDPDEGEYLLSEVELAAWRIKNSTNPIAISNAKQLLKEYGLSIDEAEEIARSRMKSYRRRT
jgi:hypothetical protein